VTFVSLRQSAIVAVAAMLVAACGKKSESPPPPPVEVSVITAHAQAVPLTRELVGRLSATRSADVRARVTGVLLKRLYNEGSLVKAGQPLFQIDPTPLRASLSGASAGLAQAEANATNAHIAAERNRELAAKALVSRASLDEAEANERSTAAQVLQAKANVDMARINLGYATVTSPIAGRSSQQRVTEGALVGQGEATLLTVVEQIDPIYVNFDQPAAEVERLRRLQSTGEVTLLDRNSAQVQVILQDGAAYKHLGTLDFLDYSVNPTTGALAFRGTVPNPERELLPGMYVNIRLTLGQLNRAFLVPQAALQRDNDGPFVKVVGTDGKVAQKRVMADTVNGPSWIVTSGLADGDQLIVLGNQKARPGAPVKIVPAPTQESSPPQAPAPASGSGGNGKQ
jgi:membrane fusion protein (multidrug efflux system)